MSPSERLAQNFARIVLRGGIYAMSSPLLPRSAKRLLRLHGLTAVAVAAGCFAAWVATWDVDKMFLQGIITIGGSLSAAGLLLFALWREGFH